MNEELTNEVLEAMTKCDDTPCAKCLAEGVCYLEGDIPMEQKLATALLEERAKPKVWGGAPEWATNGRVYWTNGFNNETYSKLYTRELPKTRARIMAEEIASAHISNKDDLIDIIEQTINAHMEELKGEA